jgi:Family of unknown function (DUF695)
MFFNKKKTEIDFPDKWIVSQGKLEDKPMFVRYRTNLEDIISCQNYNFQIGIAIPLLDSTEEGLTTDEEANSLWAIEDKLSKEFEANKEAIHVMTITYNGMREFVLYSISKKPEYFEKKVKMIEASLNNDYKLQFMIQKDEGWETYKEYSKK